MNDLQGRIPLGKLSLRGFPVLLGAAVFSIVTHGDLVFSADSIFYWSAARTLLNEHRLATRIAYPDSHREDSELVDGPAQPLHPLTVFAPGYSVAIAAAAGATRTSIVSAALLINAVSGAAILLLAGGLARRVGDEATGCAAAALLAVLPFFQQTLRNAGSDVLFAALMMLALHLLLSWRDPADRRALKLYGATLAIVAATYTRYIGLSLYVVEVIVAAPFLFRRRPATDRRSHVAPALSLYPALVAPLIWRNLSLTGYFGGAARASSESGVFTNVADVARGLIDALPLVRSFVAGPADAIVSVMLVAAATAFALWPWRDLSRMVRPSGWTSTALVLVLSAGVYGVTLIALRSRTAFETIGVRLLFPALVCLVILAVIQAAGFRNTRSHAVASMWVVFSLAATLLDAAFRPPPASLNGVDEQNQPVLAWARQNLAPRGSDGAVIFADNPYQLHFATGWPVHRLPPLSRLQDLRAHTPVEHLIFAIGPPTGLSTLQDASERKRYEDNLDTLAREVQRGEDYAVWCIPTAGHETTCERDCFPGHRTAATTGNATPADIPDMAELSSQQDARRSKRVVRRVGGDAKFVMRRIGRETIIVPVAGRVADLESVYTLNEVATRIWELLDSPRTAAQIAQLLAADYEAREEALAADVQAFLTALEEAGLAHTATER
jgi:hypothetical protein